jgi:outer membrane protein TolC
MIERVRKAGVVLTFAVVAGSAASVHAQGARELTVDEGVRIGLGNNPRLRASVADVAAAHAAYRQARAVLYPLIHSEANVTRLSNNIPDVEFTLPGTDSTVTFQGVEINRFHSELRIEQPLLSSIRLRHEARAAAGEAEAAAADAEQERADVAFEIRRAYWDLQRALAVRASLNTSITQVDEHLRDIRNRFSAGTALRKDLLAAQTRRSEVQLDVVEADNAVRVARLELNRLTGLPLQTEVRPTTEVKIDSVTGSPSGVDGRRAGWPAAAAGVGRAGGRSAFAPARSRERAASRTRFRRSLRVRAAQSVVLF